jgi:hypothetical protein
MGILAGMGGKRLRPSSGRRMTGRRITGPRDFDQFHFVSDRRGRLKSGGPRQGRYVATEDAIEYVDRAREQEPGLDGNHGQGLLLQPGADAVGVGSRFESQESFQVVRLPWVLQTRPNPTSLVGSGIRSRYASNASPRQLASRRHLTESGRNHSRPRALVGRLEETPVGKFDRDVRLTLTWMPAVSTDSPRSAIRPGPDGGVH